MVDAKNLLTKSKLPDADYVINPYIGCNHGCVYCYAEFMSRFTGHAGEEWGSFMDVKKNDKPFPKNLVGKSILIGSATDPYNPLEKRYEKTREILIRLQDTEARVEILTKSPLVLRDLDIISTQCIRVGISLGTMDAEFARLTEKHAASPQQRLETIRVLNEARVEVYAFISPIFPLFSDWKTVANETEKYVSQICFENLNLRGGYKRRVLDLISTRYPEKSEEFSYIFNENKVAYWQDVERQIHEYMASKPYKVYFFHEKIKKGR